MPELAETPPGSAHGGQALPSSGTRFIEYGDKAQSYLLANDGHTVGIRIGHVPVCPGALAVRPSFESKPVCQATRNDDMARIARFAQGHVPDQLVSHEEQ
jgi:hypothetical protein